ncbi:ATP-binding cassette subfamily C protein CydC [Arcanobacterium wilhelmae]|uniref:ATP-binding cassette subfamily C protein CydC n=1 Tax=Arcanobacterium wilhelmae TaxID=1803177 RepID=A0ABT9NE26_9ACTO|nr:thiol reductant ABC exporter subunit CydC [Arcanobacterium wilhelmae]MDP9801631.1 ATP-binding cassette subfamily C protein CydC [Arcanobacterium wilhelmae]
MSVLSKADRAALKRAIELLDYDKAKFAASVAAGTGAIGSGVALGATSAWLIARAAQLPPVLDLSVASVGVRAFGVGKAIFRYLERIASHWVALYGMSNLRTSLYQALADARTDRVASLKRGDLLARTGADVDEVGNLVVRSMLPAAVALTVSLISLAIVGILSPLIGLVFALCLAIAGIAAPWVAMHGAAWQEAHVEDRAVLGSDSLTLLEHASELRVSGRLAQMEAARERTEARIQRHRDAAARPLALAAALDILALGITVVAAIAIGGWQVATGDLSPVNYVVCVLTPLSGFEATQRMTDAGIQLIRSAAAARRIMEILDGADAPSADVAAAHAERAAEPDGSGLLANNLTIGWPGGPDVGYIGSLEVRRGESLAIVGASGIGKSTLLSTLAGLIAPHTGSVRLDGREVSELERADVSKTLILTAEDAHVFATSVLENVRVGRGNVTDAEARELLERAGLGDWLAQLPHGLATQLGSDATTMSGGERRRLLLARALASTADFLLLDEPGEHLDPITADRLIADLLHAGDGERAVVLVTHHLSALAAADRVIVLGTVDGIARVVASGTHAELAASNEAYAWALAQEGEQ